MHPVTMGKSLGAQWIRGAPKPVYRRWRRKSPCPCRETNP